MEQQIAGLIIRTQPIFIMQLFFPFYERLAGALSPSFDLEEIRLQTVHRDRPVPFRFLLCFFFCFLFFSSPP